MIRRVRKELHRVLWEQRVSFLIILLHNFEHKGSLHVGWLIIVLNESKKGPFIICSIFK